MSDVIVIGSGFGGAIAAKRFTEAGHRVALLELGEDWSAPGKAQQSQDPRFIGRLLRDYPTDRLRSKPPISATLGMGLGGGSLVYSGIHLRAPEHAFAGWPAGWTRAALDPYYARVEQRLAIATMPDAFAFGRPGAFRDGAAKAGLPPAAPVPLAMAGCTRCGWCIPICTFDKKQTMQHTYLADAARTGRLVVQVHRKAAYIARAGARYRVWSWRTDHALRDYHRVASGPLEPRDADIVVIAAGALESAPLLARSRAYDPPRGTERLRELPAVGTGLDGTGDFVQGGLVPRQVESWRGAVMMSYIDMGDFVLEDIHGLPAGAAVALDIRPAGVGKTWGRAYQDELRRWGAHMLGIAIVGAQAPGTARSLTVHDDGGNAVLGGRAYGPAPGALEAARSIVRALGGEPAETPWERSRTVITVHPTGGCAMGQVVRASDLQVENNPGLYVIDGSVLPGNPLRNPSHTIAAVAERALDIILGAPVLR